MEFFVAFLIGFFSYWFLTKEDLLSKNETICPAKESVVRIAEQCNPNSVKLRKEIKEYSLMKIQDGHYEYQDVLQTLLKKEKNDKA